MPLTLIKLTHSLTFLFFFKERRKKKRTIFYYILIIPIWIFLCLQKDSENNSCVTSALWGTCLGLLKWNPHIRSHSLHTKRDESRLKQTSQYALLWQRTYLKSSIKQSCDFSLKSVLPVALRNLTRIQAEGREWTSVSHEEILQNDGRRLEKIPNPRTRMTKSLVTTTRFYWVQLRVLHLHASWRNTNTALILILQTTY